MAVQAHEDAWNWHPHPQDPYAMRVVSGLGYGIHII